MAQRRSRRSSPSKELQPLAEYWREQQQSWLSSGLTQADFCAQHDFSLASFRWWRWKLKQDDSHREAPPAPVESHGESLRLVPVRVIDPEVRRGVPLSISASGDPSSVFEVVLTSGTCIRVPGDFDAEALSRLLRTLEAGRC